MKKPSFDGKKVTQICNSFVNQGIEPTVRGIRDKLGGGSPNDISQYLREWRKVYELATTTTDDLSPEFIQAALAECSRKVISVKENFHKQIEQRDNQLIELQNLFASLEEQNEELKEEIQKIKSEADAKQVDYESKLAGMREQVKVRNEQTNELKEKLKAQEEKFNEQLKQLQEAKHQAELKLAAAEARSGELEKQIRRKE